MRTLAAAAVLLLAACDRTDPKVADAQRAEQKLAIVTASNASPDDKCAAERAVEQAWLDALDRQKYADAKSEADLVCQNAQTSRELKL